MPCHYIFNIFIMQFECTVKSGTNLTINEKDLIFFYHEYLFQGQPS